MSRRPSATSRKWIARLLALCLGVAASCGIVATLGLGRFPTKPVGIGLAAFTCGVIGTFNLLRENIIEDSFKAVAIVLLALAVGMDAEPNVFAFPLVAACAVVLAVSTNAYARHLSP